MIPVRKTLSCSKVSLKMVFIRANTITLYKDSNTDNIMSL